MKINNTALPELIFIIWKSHITDRQIEIRISIKIAIIFDLIFIQTLTLIVLSQDPDMIFVLSNCTQRTAASCPLQFKILCQLNNSFQLLK